MLLVVGELALAEHKVSLVPFCERVAHGGCLVLAAALLGEPAAALNHECVFFFGHSSHARPHHKVERLFPKVVRS